MKNEMSCDALLNDPALATPPPEPVAPPPPRPPRRKKFVFPERFALITVDQYNSWVNHRKELALMTPFVDDRPPELFPELYLKPRRLDFYARQLEENMIINKQLLKRINLIQRTGGFVDCWQTWAPGSNYNKLLCAARQKVLDGIQNDNRYLYQRLVTARSDMPLTKEMDEEWIETKKKLILGASLPFILFNTVAIDRGFKDPSFDKPPNVTRNKVMMDIWVEGGSKIGRLFVELFNDIVPKTCELFLTLIKGDGVGHGYKGTSIFRVIPGLYCRAGDVTKNNGFGCYMQAGMKEPMTAENYVLKHTVPGVLSMAVTKDNEVCGHFNIIFKPLQQLDGSNVVFGRVVAGPSEALDRISAQGSPLGTPQDGVVIRSCGSYNRRGRYIEGAANTVRFPGSRKQRKGT